MIERIKNILFSPRREWPAIAEEATTVRGVYVPWVLALAAIPVLFNFIKGSLIGHGMFGVTVRVPFGSGIGRMVFAYAISLVLVFVMALIVDALAPTFQAQKNRIQALKTVAYAWTASWLAGVAVVVPALGWLIVLTGGAYSIRLLYLGLPHTMKCPREKAAGYTAASVIIAVLLSVVMMWGAGAMVGASVLRGGMSISQDTVDIDTETGLGKIMAMAKQVEVAASQADKKRRANGDTGHVSRSASAVLGAWSGSKDGKPVPALDPQQLEAFLPESLGGLTRTAVSSRRQQAAVMEMTIAKATYRDADRKRTATLTLHDMPTMGGAMAFSRALAGREESSSRSEQGYEKTYSREDRHFEEKWDNQRHHGQFSVLFADRFKIKIEGDAGSLEELKQMVDSLDLEGLQRVAGK